MIPKSDRVFLVAMAGFFAVATIAWHEANTPQRTTAILRCGDELVPLRTRAFDGGPIIPRCSTDLYVAELIDQGCGDGHWWGLRRVPAFLGCNSSHKQNLSQSDKEKQPRLSLTEPAAIVMEGWNGLRPY